MKLWTPHLKESCFDYRKRSGGKMVWVHFPSRTAYRLDQEAGGELRGLESASSDGRKLAGITSEGHCVLWRLPKVEGGYADE